MIDLPDFSRDFEWENNFYLACDSSRMAKVLAHYELFKLSAGAPGAIVECGVFKGASLARFAMFRDLFASAQARKIIGFDMFGPFPETAFAPDQAKRARFIREAGNQSIAVDQLMQVLAHKRCDRNVELVAGDICATVPKYVQEHPELKIALLHLDTDIYEPSAAILEHLYPRLATGGVLVLDDYGSFPGETKAVDDYFQGQHVLIRKLPFCANPSYLIKE